MSNISKHTNMFLDGEVLGYTPDGSGDYYKITDFSRDFTYLQEKIAFAVRGIMGQGDQDFVILYGGEVTDSGGGQVDISEGLAIGMDADSNTRFIPIPAQSNVPIPAGWNDGRQIWVIGEHLFKLSTDTRDHKQTVTSYHYTVEDSYLGETDSDDLFTDSDPGGSQVIWGSFTMTGTTFASLDSGERSDWYRGIGITSPVSQLHIHEPSSGASIIHLTNSTTGATASDGFDVSIDASEQAVLWNYENTDLIIATNNTGRIWTKNDGKIGFGTSSPQAWMQLGANGDTDRKTFRVGQNNQNDCDIHFSTDAGDYTIGYDQNVNKFKISASSALGTSDVMQISAGFVGWGVSPSTPWHLENTTTPQFRLAYDTDSYMTIGVDSSSNVTINSVENGLLQITGDAINLFKINRTTDGHVAMLIEENSTVQGMLAYDNTNDLVKINRGSSVTGANHIVVNSSGYVGINYNNPNRQLYVDGNTYGSGYIQAGGQILCSDSTDSTDKDTGSIITEGGIAAEKNIISGGYVQAYGFVKSGRGRWPTGKLHMNSPSHNDIFDALDSSIPNNGDEIILNGCFSIATNARIPSYAIRVTSTTITIYYGDAGGSTINTVTITDGSSTSWDSISIAW